MTCRHTVSRPPNVMKTMKDGPSLDILREHLDYDPATGIFYRKKAPRNHIDVGSVAGYLCPNGYVAIQILNRRYAAHRLAWLYVHEEWPHLLVDHIDRNRSNNRISNLRLATPSFNSRHVVAPKNRRRSVSPEGVCPTGVHWIGYRAKIIVEGKHIGLGKFDTMQEAAAAVRAAELRYFGDKRVAPSFGGASEC